MTYTERIHRLLTKSECRVLSPLSSPSRIQDYLDTLPINFEYARETCMSPRLVMRVKKAHCFEAALFAAAALAYHGRVPYLMDFQTMANDEDHVIALFQERGKWGAISKTNHAPLRYRDPVYQTPHELGMSYFHEYFLWSGKKSLRAFSKPFNLRSFNPERWITSEKDLYWLERALDRAPHYPVLKKGVHLRKVSLVELRAMKLVEWKKRTSRYKYKPRIIT